MNSLHTPKLPYAGEATTKCANCDKEIRYQNGAPLSAFASVYSGSFNCSRKVTK